LFAIGLTACFAGPLIALVRFSLHDQCFNYIPLIPVISLYLIVLKSPKLPPRSGLSWKRGSVWMMGGLLLLIGCKWATLGHGKPRPEDYLACMTASFLLFLVGGCVTFLGSGICRQLLFPLAFLTFMAPIPSGLFDWTTRFFQQTSAATTHGFLTAAGMPVFRQGMTFHMPGFTLLIVPECAGMHSTVVFIISAVLTAHLFLRTGWKRASLVALAIPLAILRNAFRLFVLSELCVHISPNMIDSFVHERGGPIFFAISFLPLLAVLALMRKSENLDATVAVRLASEN
jgi:exosortase C (VPDSG-CTERM-specific)